MDKQSLLDLLRHDARQSVDDIARQLGADADAVAAALDELESEGAVRGYHAVVDWRQVDDEHVRAQVEVDVELDRETGYDEIARRIARFPEVRSLRLVSGTYDFFIEVEGESMHAVSNFVSERIAPIPEVTKTVTHFVMDSYKEEGIELGNGDDDDRLSVSP
ncbi:Lrp/AsnC family transcription regulator [Haloferax mucosum ATCC BAA-1512]|uniref:Lrp/AsnC family transcription regulator n=1 Tax=Haloferax mucosum ATCC BAA-1512 TaxID=662479 RepID=M0I786_9EURY|nr:Lrp/AsnC family transcriptional regulator [Haloferax mucosum]ELZ91309.1 Lrp/AsnC family transcription regulator [Haloferax mucosum ATCC BAA-1512]